MKMVKHNGRLGKMLKNGADLCRRHIHGDSLYFCPGTSELFPERIKGVTSLAVANENHRSCVHVQNHRHVPMPFENRNLIYGNPLDIFQAWPGKSPDQIPLLNLLDHVPGDSQMSGDILSGHKFRQIQRIPFKSVTIRKPGIGKSELLLADLPATPTFKPLNLKIEKYPLRTDRNRPKSPGKRSPKEGITVILVGELLGL